MALALAAAATAGALRAGLDGLSLDLLFWLRYAAFGARHDPAASPTVVIAIDEETFRTEPFRTIPQALWAPHLAAVLRAVLAAGPKVVGVDVIFPTTVEPFLPGFERDFRLALHDGAKAGKVVLTKEQQQNQPVAPYPGLSLAVGNERNIRLANLFRDDDDTIRRVPLLFDAETADGGTRRDPSFALELAERASGAAVSEGPDGIALGGYRIPGSDTDTLLVNFDGGQSLPTYSFADLDACAAAGRADWFASRFAGKVVLLGAVQDLEDRKITSKRLITGGEPATPDRCIRPVMAGLMRNDVVRSTIPGVYIHAAAVNDFLRRDALAELRGPGRGTAVAAVAAAVAALLLVLPIGLGALAAAGLGTLWAAAATLTFQHGLALPMLPGLVAGGLTAVLLTGYRVTVADRDKRRLRHMFGLYLAPSIVDQLAAADGMPELGGERRAMTFLFTDVAGFTTLTERTDPAVMAAALNDYLDGACRIIMAHGGLVNEFIGDAILAFFGAPQHQADHAARALACARAIDAYAEAFRQRQAATGLAFGHTRIGLHCGDAMVGNFGSRQRFKYAALGDVVNTASRIEGLNKFFGTRLAVSGAVVAAAGAEPDGLRPLGEFVLKGKSAALVVFEAFDPAAADPTYMERYRAAYAAMAAGDPAASGLFAALAAAAPADGAAAFHCRRLATGATGPVIAMDEK